MSKILIVDDDRTARKGLYFNLKSTADHILEAQNVEEANDLTERHDFDLIIIDLRIPTEKEGFALLKRIKHRYPLSPVLMVTAYGSVDSAVEAMKAGATDYTTKDFSREEIILKVEKLLETRKLWLANLRLTEQVNTLKNKYGAVSEQDQIIAVSSKMKSILNLLSRISQDKDSTVLITGESGTGKELIARSIHQNNPQRRDNKFVVVDIANMPSTLLESQLFGHEKGAFTNAYQRHSGLFETANGGTAFLDEIGDFPLELQVKLLRFLQERTFTRVGGDTPIYSDVRILAATNKDLEQLVKKERFREDLYYRLNVIQIHIPPLRERREDILPLIHYFKQKFEQKKGRKLEFPQKIIREMVNHSWPGNIRQLKNFMESLYVTCPEEVVREDDLTFGRLELSQPQTDPFSDLFNMPLKEAKQELITNFERSYIKYNLEMNNNNISKLAAMVGESREGLSKKIKRYGIK